MDASIYRLRHLLVVCVISLLLLDVLTVQSACVRVSDAGTTFWTGPAAKHLIMRHPTTSRYPTPDSVGRCFGRVGLASSFWRSWFIYTRR